MDCSGILPTLLDRCKCFIREDTVGSSASRKPGTFCVIVPVRLGVVTADAILVGDFLDGVAAGLLLVDSVVVPDWNVLVVATELRLLRRCLADDVAVAYVAALEDVAGAG